MDVEGRPIAQWLRSSRLHQTDERGEAWTQDQLLERMRADVGWAPHRPNYSAYEQGRSTPNRETLAKFVSFWGMHGVGGPDMEPPAPARSPATLEDLIAAMAEDAALRREELEATRQQTAVLMSIVSALLPGGSGPRPPGLEEELVRQYDRALEEATHGRSPGPSQPGQGGTPTADPTGPRPGTKAAAVAA